MIPSAVFACELGTPTDIADAQAAIDAALSAAMARGYIPESLQVLPTMRPDGTPFDGLVLMASAPGATDWPSVSLASALVGLASPEAASSVAYGMAASKQSSATPSLRSTVLVSCVIGGIPSDLLVALFTNGSATGSFVPVPSTRTLTAGAGLTGGGDLSADRTFNVGANPDGSIAVHVDDIQVGVLASDAQHGARGGGTQHALVVPAGAAGFMSGADKTKLDSLLPSGIVNWSVPHWYIDPVAGNNANDGLTSHSAIQTYSELIRRWGTTSPLLGQDTIVEFLTDQPGLTDPVVFSGETGSQAGTLTIKGQLVAQPSGTGNFTIVASRNRAAGTLWSINATAKPAGFWAPFVGCFVHDTTADAWFWVDADLGGGSATISEPVATSVGNSVPAYVTIHNADAFIVYSPTKVNVTQLSGDAASGMSFELQHVWTQGVNLATDGTNNGPQFTECRIDSLVESAFPGFSNCYLFGVTLRGGFLTSGVVTFELVCAQGNENVIDGDVLVMGAALGVKGTLIVGAAYFANTLDVPTLNLGGSTGQIYVTGALYGTAALWGPASLAGHVGGDIGYTGLAASSLLSLGGLTLDGVGRASAYDLTTGLWTPGRALNPGQLDATVAAGGFGGVAYGENGSKIRLIA